MAKKDSGSDRKVLGPLCMGCDHLGKPYSVMRVRGEKRIQYKCDLHGILVGESSVCCKDGTNIEAFFEARTPKTVKREAAGSGWEDY